MITLPKPLIDAKPGDPITSESWNNTLAAIKTLYEALNKLLGSLTVSLTNQADGNPVRTAVVTLIPKDDPTRPVRSALFAGGPVNRYIVNSLQPGKYMVVIEADGFHDEKRAITIKENGEPQELSVDMAVKEILFPMPSLFGQALNVAMERLQQAQLQVGELIDSHGKRLVPSDLSDEAMTSLVLNQEPDPGTLIPKNTPVKIHVSAKAEATRRVKVPDLTGLTYNEAKSTIEASGLTLGKIRYVR